MNSDVRQAVATASRVLGGAGLGDLIWGHASARDPAGRGVWLKCAGWGMEEITPERVMLVSNDGTVLEGEGQRHSEYSIHTQIIAARPDVGGVVHTHSPHAVALAAAGVPLLPVSHAATYFVPPVVPRYSDTADLILTPELGQEVAHILGDCNAVFLVNHGIVTVGPDLQSATIAAILLESACQQQLLTRGYGGWATWSEDDESLSKRQNIYGGSGQSLWDYLVRRLGA